MTRCGQLSNILNSDKISLDLKLRLYEASVLSLLTFGCETWTLSPQVLRMLNGANSRMLARFTGQSIPKEARPQTTSLNIIRKIRQRRLRWVGHILRAGSHRLAYKALQVQQQLAKQGHLLMDAPPSLKHGSFSRASQRQSRLVRPCKINSSILVINPWSPRAIWVLQKSKEKERIELEFSYSRYFIHEFIFIYLYI